LSLYPEGHPRVLETVAAIKADLALHLRETGRPFAIETSTTIEESARGGRRKGETDVVTVGRLLKLHLISSVTLLPEASSDELIPFCFLLEEDVARASEEGLWEKINPDDWDHIRLSFYTPDDFPDFIPTAEASLKRSAGMRRIKNVEALFSNLPESIREKVQKALIEPAFLQKFADLRRSFRQRLPASTKADGKKIDLFSEVLRSVFSTPQLSTSSQGSAEEVIAAIHGVVGFFEENVDALAIDVNTRPDGPDPATVGKQIEETLRVGSGLSKLANAVQVQKQRLGFLFHTSSEVNPLSVQGEKSEAVHGHAEQSKPEVLRSHESKDDRKTPALPLESQLKNVVYDLGSFEKLLKESDAYDNYVQIVLELLNQDEYREGVSKLWPFISAVFLNASAVRLQNALGVVCDFIREAGNARAEDLLVEILSRASPPELVLRTLEDVVLPRGSPRLAATCMMRLAEKDPAGTLPLLCLAHSTSKSLQEVAEVRLIHLAADPELLLEWAMRCPEGLLRPMVFKKLLESLKREQVLRAFKLFFARAPDPQATRILTEFPAGIEGGADVFFAALEKGSPSIRNVAITNSFRCPTPSVIATLVEIVKENNYKREPDMEELEAALKSLQGIKDPLAGNFLVEVLRGRRGLRRTYRKEIRRALESLRSKGMGPL
jgi:hypothetical protein